MWNPPASTIIEQPPAIQPASHSFLRTPQWRDRSFRLPLPVSSRLVRAPFGLQLSSLFLSRCLRYISSSLCQSVRVSAVLLLVVSGEGGHSGRRPPRGCRVAGGVKGSAHSQSGRTEMTWSSIEWGRRRCCGCCGGGRRTERHAAPAWWRLRRDL